jgi:hypothetical protein
VGKQELFSACAGRSAERGGDFVLILRCKAEKQAALPCTVSEHVAQWPSDDACLIQLPVVDRSVAPGEKLIR